MTVERSQVPIGEQETAQAIMASGNAIILDAYMKAHEVLSKHSRASVSISGGADSDIMLDLIERVRGGTDCEVLYVWFDTGFEYEATKRHLRYLEERYGVTIMRERAKKVIPTCVREYGQPFLSKYVSMQIESLQRVGFDWSDEPLDALLGRYENCKTALRWWTNDYPGNRSTYEIDNVRMLKEFMLENPPDFPISSKCCDYAKKKVSNDFCDREGVDLSCVGVRKAEGGLRSKNPNTTCYSERYRSNHDTYRPLFWFKNEDCEQYREVFSIRRSDCYEVWGLTRTGCAGCPFSLNLKETLSLIDTYEPKIGRAVRNTFADAYAYTERFNEYRRRVRFSRKADWGGNWKRLFTDIGDNPEW